MSILRQEVAANRIDRTSTLYQDRSIGYRTVDVQCSLIKLGSQSLHTQADRLRLSMRLQAFA